MNERIKRLADKARLTAVEEMFEGELNTFAELIVRECEKVSLKSSHRDDDMGAIIARQIKEHFGIEEYSIDEQLRNRSTYFGNDL